MLTLDLLLMSIPDPPILHNVKRGGQMQIRQHRAITFVSPHFSILHTKVSDALYYLSAGTGKQRWISTHKALEVAFFRLKA